jgi:hypothetical protein
MQPAINGQPADKGITLRLGDKVRTPQGLMLIVNAFNRPMLQGMLEAGFPLPPPPLKPVRLGPARLFKRAG